MLLSNTTVLATPDVPATAAWYRDVLGFRVAWIWTPDDPSFGCVQRDGQAVFLGRRTAVPSDLQHCFGVDDVDALYTEHTSAGAPIAETIENKPWGTREYVIRDPNGYRIRFSGPILARSRTLASLPNGICIQARTPTVMEYLAVEEAVNPRSKHPDAEAKVGAMVAGAVALDVSGQPVGMACAVGDGLTVVYVHSVGVRPAQQGQGIGTALMANLIKSLRERCAPETPILLLTGKPAFYTPFGFRPEGGLMMARV